MAGTAAKPWMMFYPQDWRADESLRLCSYAARGLWLEMLALMHRSERYGYLLVKGQAPTDRQLAALTGGTVDEVTALISELETFDVFNRDRNGTIYSRRMIRDEKRSKTNAKNGAKGGNPKLRKQTGNSGSPNPAENPADKGEVKPQSPESIDHSNSVPNGTAAEAAQDPDPDKIFWDNAKGWLKPHVKGDPGAMIGKWLRENGKELTQAAISAGQLEKAVSPIEYCQGYFRRNKPQPRHQGGSGDQSFLDYKIDQKRQQEEWARAAGDAR